MIRDFPALLSNSSTLTTLFNELACSRFPTGIIRNQGGSSAYSDNHKARLAQCDSACQAKSKPQAQGLQQTTVHAFQVSL